MSFERLLSRAGSGLATGRWLAVSFEENTVTPQLMALHCRNVRGYYPRITYHVVPSLAELYSMTSISGMGAG